MIYKTHFYHELLKKYSLVMGALLDGIDVVRYNADGTENSRQRVPVVYSEKEKFIQRTQADTDLLRQPAIVLPRIGYEMTSLSYAPDRKISGKHRFVYFNETNKTSAVYTPVPYDITYSATLIAKSKSDAYQVVEQLAPFFTPDYTIAMRGVGNPEIGYDVPITLVSNSSTDTYDGEFEQRRTIQWRFDFVVKGFLFGPVRESGIIKTVDVTLYDYSQLDVNPALRNFLVNYNFVPYINGVSLANIGANDPYTIKETITG
jgi:hypothetical protein